MRYAIVLINMNNVERDAHEPHVNAAARLQHESGSWRQLAPAHQTPEPSPVRVGQLGSLGKYLVSGAVDDADSSHH
jgi:hypothetical protein